MSADRYHPPGGAPLDDVPAAVAFLLLLLCAGLAFPILMSLGWI